MSKEKHPLETSSGEDEFVSCNQCQIMFDKNDKSHVLSECFERCHYFCPPCIQLLMKGSNTDKKLVCPLCKLSEIEEEINEQLWCFDCNVPASIGCYEENHTIQKYDHLFNARSLQLKCQLNKTNSVCDDALRNCRQIQSVHQVILAWMQWLLREITQWDSSNNSTIAQLESLRASEGFHVQQERNLQFTINKINELIIRANNQFQEVLAKKLEVGRLFDTYNSCSQQTSSVGSAELMKLFSTSLNQTNQSCINVLAFLISFLGQGEKRMKESEQVSDGVADKLGMRRTGQFLKRRIEEVPESFSCTCKKARKDSSVRSKPNLSSDLLGTEFKEAMELCLAEVNEKRAALVRELEEIKDKLKLSEERAAMLAKEAERNKDLPNRIARLETDLELLVKQVEQAQQSELKANQEALNQKKRAKEVQEKYEIELSNHTADVEQLKTVCEQLVQSKSQVAAVLWELTNRTTTDESKKLQREKESLEKRLEQVQMQVEKMKVAQEKSKLHHSCNYKTQLEELKIKYDKLVRENEKCRSNLAASQAEQVKAQKCVKVKSELEKAKQDSEKIEIKKPIKQLQIHNLNAIVKDLLTSLRNKKEFDCFVYPCSNCKSRIEVGFYCGKCEDFLLCLQCHEKDGHQHKMENFGFDLDRNKSSSPAMDIQKARKLRVDRRILSLVHSCNCSVANCDEPFCRTMKAVIKHNIVCHAKTSIGLIKGSRTLQTGCVICRQLVGLFICHAKYCNDLDCKIPYCPNVKKKIGVLFQNNALPQKKVSRSQKSQMNPNLEPLGLPNKNQVSVKATTTSSAELPKQDLSKKQVQDASPSVNFPLAVHNVIHSAPTSAGSVNNAKTPNPAAITYEENLKTVQDHVAMIVHAHKCQEGVNQANNTCSTPYCLKMKNHLNHVISCQDGHSCQVPYCPHSKAIISHWSNCCLSDCPFCVGLKESHPSVDLQSNVVGETALTVKPFDAVGGVQAPLKPAGPMPRLQRAPFYQLNSIPLMNNVRSATPPLIVSHEGRKIQDVVVNQLTRVGKDAVYTTNSVGDRPQLQKICKGDGKTLQSNVSHPTTPSVLHPSPKYNLLASQNSEIRVLNQVICTVGAKKHVIRNVVADNNKRGNIGADSEKRGTLQQLVNSIPQHSMAKKTEHLNLAIAMGGGVCCPVWALSRERLGKLLLDPAKFGCNFRTTLKNLLMEIKSPKVTKESRQKIADFFGIHYLFVCSFFRKQCELNVE